MKYTLLFIQLIFTGSLCAQTDTVYVEEYDTIIVSKDPVVISTKHYEYFVPSEKKYGVLFYLSAGSVFNNTTMCNRYSKDSLKHARQSAYFFSFNTLIQKRFKKLIGFEVGLSVDYFQQEYSYPKNTLVQETIISSVFYAGLQSSVSYKIIDSKKNFNLVYYIGLKGLLETSQNGYMYNVVDAYNPNEIATQTKSFNYGFISRLEASYKTGYNSSFVFGINYYFDLKPYTKIDSDYYIHRNVPGIFLGYRIGF